MNSGQISTDIDIDAIGSNGFESMRDTVNGLKKGQENQSKQFNKKIE